MKGTIGHTFGEKHHPYTYRSWKAMQERCTSPRHHRYRHYAGRGISIDPRWRDFRNFLQDMGERPLGMTIDRIDNDGDYRKENCRWATMVEQRHSRREPKLDLAKVTEIIRRRAMGQRPVDIARDFGISQPTVSNIFAGRIWRRISSA